MENHQLIKGGAISTGLLYTSITITNWLFNCEKHTNN